MRRDKKNVLDCTREPPCWNLDSLCTRCVLLSVAVPFWSVTVRSLWLSIRRLKSINSVLWFTQWYHCHRITKNFNQGFRYYWLRLRLNILTILLGVPIWNFHEVFVFGISKTKFFAPVPVRATGKNIYDYRLYRKKKEIHVISRLFRYTYF